MTSKHNPHMQIILNQEKQNPHHVIGANNSHMLSYSDIQNDPFN